MDALNNVSLTSYLNGLSSSGWSTFADDLESNWASAWSSRFDLTSRWSTALGQVPTTMKEAIIDGCNRMSTEIGAGRLADISGIAFDPDPSGGEAPSIRVRMYIDIVRLPGSIYTVSFMLWISAR